MRKLVIDAGLAAGILAALAFGAVPAAAATTTTCQGPKPCEKLAKECAAKGGRYTPMQERGRKVEGSCTIG
jgi:hypothetical protein